MSGLPIARFDDLDEARRVLLSRREIGDTPLPASVTEKIREVFGEPLTPAQVVERIIADVRAAGDKAGRRYTRLIDGHDVGDLCVTPEQIDAAVDRVPIDVFTGLEEA